ncbi:MAG: AarF/ABC1/UbiB kinase family protein [Kofleriaceae bacterium]|jgi:ubiquinone biosynthesis protein|nr:AarF/ABC1/UbiB kinase family protein [Kofleriaceae bacterium]MBP9172841.1 AarF/ABC1/UbiB kinase family protein [Kofleriaceae bacterium]MBP9861758.1 AarF/ABC1/UbiB kinase family protein [Kofleriaceae bacterium]
MWAALRLIRAMRVFGTIFVSYLWQLSWARLWPTRYGTPERWRKIHRKNARRMYKGFVRLRGVYIKLGQILSIMGTFLPRSYVEELEGLQDEVPAQPYRTIARAFERALGKSPSAAFASFGKTPIAAASLGQVHEARTADGTRLAVKVLYPNVAEIIRVDLRVLGWALKIYRTFVPINQIERVHEQLGDMLARETDLANEARCIERMRTNFADDPDTLFPTVYPTWSCQTVLTMSFMDGVKISKKDALSTLGLDPYAVATKLTQVFYKQLFLDRFFHADPHPGNFFVQKGPAGQVRIVVLDLGSATALSGNLADGMLDILQGLLTKNDDMVVRGIETMGFVAEGGDRALLERTVRRYFEKLLNLNITDFSRIDPNVAQQLADPDMRRDELRELMKAIAYPEGWFYVERAAVIMFGLSSQLAPKLNTVQVGMPYVMKFMMAKAAERRAAAPASSSQ